MLSGSFNPIMLPCSVPSIRLCLQIFAYYVADAFMHTWKRDLKGEFGCQNGIPAAPFD